MGREVQPCAPLRHIVPVDLVTLYFQHTDNIAQVFLRATFAIVLELFRLLFYDEVRRLDSRDSETRHEALASMAEVVLGNLSKHFRATGRGGDSTFTLGPLDLAVPNGELTVLAGPSGCGKTTLLRLIAGLESPSSGSVSIGGRKMDGVPPHERNVAMVFQDHALYPHMTVRGNLAFPLKMRKVASGEIDGRVRETAEALEIDDLLDRRPNELSGGQQQRVALGRAIVRHPDVSLLDEPLAHLDAHLRVEMRKLLVDLQCRLGLTMLHVTHDQAEATAMADNIVVLYDGHIEQVGKLRDLRETPANERVAVFFSSPS